LTAPSPSSTAGVRVQPARTTRNVLANWGAFAFAIGVNLFLSPFIVHSLGNTGYGLWVLLAEVVGYMGLLDLGVRSAVMRYVARYHAVRRDEEAGRIASAGLALFVAFGVGAVLVASGLTLVIHRVFNIPPDLIGVARLILVLGGLNVALALIAGVFGGIVSGLQRFDLLAGSEVSVGALRAVLIVAALHQGYGLLALAAIQLLCTTLRAGWQYRFARRLYPELRFALRTWTRVHVRDIFSFGAYSSIIALSSMLVLQASSIIIGAFQPVERIAYFAIGATLTGYAQHVINAIAQNVAPRAAALEARGAGGELRNVVLRFSRIASLVLMTLAATFLIRGATFIEAWMGPEYAGPSGRVLWILSLALVPWGARRVALATLSGLNLHRRLAPFFLAEALLSVGASVFWVQRLGIEGVAWGTTAPALVVTLVAIPWLTRQALGISIGQVISHFWLRPALAIVPYAIASWLVERWWPAGHLLTFFAQVAVALPVAAAGAWFMGLTAAERGSYVTAFGPPLRAALARTNVR
jgi:O-antigen/teichoic acid export membrane protein